jgi:ABC-type glycerol-3-phosphate transport system substrate-binding protein
MRWNIAIVAAILLFMSLIAAFWQPELDLKGRKQLIWTTDPNPQRDDQVTTFNKLYPEYKLRIDPDNTGTQKVITQCSANMGPDLIDGVTNQSYQLYHSAGILKDITEEAKEMGFGPETLSPAIRSLVMLKILDKDGKIKRRQFIYPCNVFHTYIILNKNVFEKNGVSLPKGDVTWEELLKKAEKLTVYKHKGDSIPESFGIAGVALIDLIWQKGGAIINKDGTRSLLDSEAVLNAAMFLHELYYKYKVMPTPIQKSGMSTQGGWGGGGYFNYLAEGRIAMIVNARYSLIQFRRLIRSQKIAREKFLKENPGKEAEAPEVLKLGACLIPRFKGHKRYCRMGTRSTGINANAKNPEGALKFMQYLVSKKYADLINKGADSKPGPSKYYKLDLMINPAYPGEEEVHAASLISTPYGRAFPRSPFITVTKLKIILKKVEQKIIAEKNLTRKDIAVMLKRATMQTDEIIARNIKRNTYLYKFYNKLLEQGAQPIRTNLDEVSE